MSVFNLAVSYLIMSSFPWFMDITFQIPIQYCSWQLQTLLSPPDTQLICFGPLASFLLVVQFLSHDQHFATQWTVASQASVSFTISQTLLKFMFIESVMPSNHLALCHPLLLPSVFPSIRVFSNVSVLCIRWPKFWSLASASVLPVNI